MNWKALRNFALSGLLVGIVCLSSFHYLVNKVSVPVKQTLADVTDTVQSSPLANGQVGVYEWRDVTTLDYSKYPAALKSLKNQGISVIYLNINYYVDAQEQPEPDARIAEKSKFEQNLKKYLSVASLNGFQVQAVAGAQKWSSPKLLYLNSMMLNFVHEFNNSSANPDKLAGLQFDIEPYNLPEFNKNKQRMLSEYLFAVEDIVAKQQNKENHGQSLKLGFTLPFWYDGDSGTIGPINFGGTAELPVNHVLKSLNGLQDPYVVLMDYRNHADGKDGAINHVRNEFNFINENKLKTKVVIGQEVTNVQPAKTTFFNQGKPRLKESIKKLQAVYSQNPAYQGLAINDLPTYLSLFK